VKSQFNTCYATLLNLYRSYGRELIKIYPRSFHFFQSSKEGKRMGYQSIENKLKLLENLNHIHQNKLTEKGEFASNLYGYELLLAELKDIGYLDQMDEIELAITLGALVFEPRKHDEKPRYSKRVQKLENTLESLAKNLYRKEYKFKIFPHSKLPHFHLGPAIEVWMTGADFEKIMAITHTDEGEIVRYFRMISQLLRQIREAHGATESLKEKAQATFRKMNRDIIDAERQLRS
jgi:superfamily II RNA helicase